MCVRNYRFDECRNDYRLNLMITMITSVATCGTLDIVNGMTTKWLVWSAPKVQQPMSFSEEKDHLRG
jgi:hypothetical protein